MKSSLGNIPEELAAKILSQSGDGKPAPQEKPRKYRNEPCKIDGHKFASKKERRRWLELRLLEKAGEIGSIVCQPKYALIVQGVYVGKYIGDFLYVDIRTGRSIVEDVKSPATKTPVYRLKKRLVAAIYGIDVVEV